MLQGKTSAADTEDAVQNKERRRRQLGCPRMHREKAVGVEGTELSPGDQPALLKASRAKHHRAAGNTSPKRRLQRHQARNKQAKTFDRPPEVSGAGSVYKGFSFVALSRPTTDQCGLCGLYDQIGFHSAARGLPEPALFPKAKTVFDGTVVFCKRFLEKRDRTVDQMVQAARSGKQNILRAALPPAHQMRLKSSWSMWHEPAWANFSSTTTIFCALAICDSGKRIAGRRRLCDG
jgi:hypothetical protein